MLLYNHNQARPTTMRISNKKTYFVRVIHVNSGETVIMRTCISAPVAREYKASYGPSELYKLIMFPMDEYNHKASHVDGWDKTEFGWVPSAPMRNKDGKAVTMEDNGYNRIPTAK